MVRADRGQPRGPGADTHLRAGQAAAGSAGRGRYRRRLCRILRRRGAPRLWRDHSLAAARCAAARHQAADRRLRRDHAVEFPLLDDHPQGLAGARRRLHRGAEARQRDAAHRAGAGGARGAGRRAEGRVQYPDRQLLGDRQGAVRTSRRAVHRLHRLDRGRQDPVSAGRRRREEARARAWRQCAVCGVRRCDVDAAVDGAIVSKYRNMGQTCVCANRIYAQDKIYDSFVQKLSAKVAAMKIGDGTEQGVVQGPLINLAAIEKVEKHIADAVKGGAKVITGGKRHSLGGTFFEPTVLANVRRDALVSQEETFGPLAPVFRFKDEAEVVAMCNDSPFGLASYFYSRDLGRVWRVAEALESGMVGVNTGLITTEVAPFGGVKESGLGREGSHHGMEEYVEIKYVMMAGI